MKILIIKNDGIGDLVLASGVISLLASRFASRLDLITCEQNKEIAKLIEGVNHTYYVSRDSIRKYNILNEKRIKPPFRKPFDGSNIIWFNSAERDILTDINSIVYDLVIVLRRYIRQSSLLLLNQIKAHKKLCMWEYPVNLSYSMAYELTGDSMRLTTRNLESFIASELEYYEGILSAFFGTSIYSNPKLKIKGYETKNNIKRADTIGVIISGASVLVEAKYWIKVCSYIARLGYNIMLFGSKGQAKDVEKILSAVPAIDNCIGKYNFDEYAYIFSSLCCIIGNDTGLTHYASVFNKKVLVFLGGGTFGSFFPWRKNTPQSISYKKMDCYYCLWNCARDNKYECIKSIFEDDVYKKDIDLFLG